MFSQADRLPSLLPPQNYKRKIEILKESSNLVWEQFSLF